MAYKTFVKGLIGLFILYFASLIISTIFGDYDRLFLTLGGGIRRGVGTPL